MSTKSKRHTHKYYRAESIGQKVWACALPDCNHFMPPHYEFLVKGKASLCWKCGEKMILDETNMRDSKPICDDCTPITAVIREMHSPIAQGEERVARVEKLREELHNKSVEESKPDKGKCSKCGAETRAPQFTLCVPCALK